MFAWQLGLAAERNLPVSIHCLQAWGRLLEMLRERIADESLMRLVGKCLHVGILDGEEYSEPETGTVQGSVLSPLLGNVYLHNVLDRWVEEEVTPRLRGRCVLIRYADDFVLGFETLEDARRVEAVLRQRMARHGLTLHPEKTRLLAFQPPGSPGGRKGSASFDFLGFTLYWQRTRRGTWRMAWKTRSGRLRRAISAVADWCRSHRCLPVEEQHAALARKLQGHYAYFGVNGNQRSLGELCHRAGRIWRRWLDRRSQRARMTWKRMNELLRRLPLPRPRVVVDLWTT